MITCDGCCWCYSYQRQEYYSIIGINVQILIFHTLAKSLTLKLKTIFKTHLKLLFSACCFSNWNIISWLQYASFIAILNNLFPNLKDARWLRNVQDVYAHIQLLLSKHLKQWANIEKLLRKILPWCQTKLNSCFIWGANKLFYSKNKRTNLKLVAEKYTPFNEYSVKTVHTYLVNHKWF